MRIVDISQTNGDKNPIVTFRFFSKNQLFDDSYSCPIQENELSELAEDILFEYVDEYVPSKHIELIVEIPEKDFQPGTEEEVSRAISTHFARRLPGINHDIRLVKREAVYSSAITGVNMILGITLITLYEMGMIVETWYTLVIAFIILILNWASLWDTLEMFLYDYRNIFRKRRIYRKISRIPVSVRRYS